MIKNTKLCAGVEPDDIYDGAFLHCSGCTSATERIAELEQELKDWKQLFVDVQKSRRMDCVSHGKLRAELGVKITSMRTLAGELVEAIHWCDDGPGTYNDQVMKEVLSKAEKLGVK